MKINFLKNNNLVPTIIQDEKSGDILMLGYMNKQALTKTQTTGFVYFWSRSKQKLWMKGEKSGNKLKLKNIFVDCDQDTLLIKAELIGKSACHTGNKTCFSDKLMRVARPEGLPQRAVRSSEDEARTSTAGTRSGQDPQSL